MARDSVTSVYLSQLDSCQEQAELVVQLKSSGFEAHSDLRPQGLWVLKPVGGGSGENHRLDWSTKHSAIDLAAVLAVGECLNVGLLDRPSAAAEYLHDLRHGLAWSFHLRESWVALFAEL